MQFSFGKILLSIAFLSLYCEKSRVFPPNTKLWHNIKYSLYTCAPFFPCYTSVLAKYLFPFSPLRKLSQSLWFLCPKPCSSLIHSRQALLYSKILGFWETHCRGTANCWSFRLWISYFLFLSWSAVLNVLKNHLWNLNKMWILRP